MKMKINNSLKRFMLLIVALTVLSSGFVSAVCPVCIVAVGAGVGILRAYGVDDLISGLWVGALILSISLWTIDYMHRKKCTFKFYAPIVHILFFGLTFLFLYIYKIIGHPDNALFGVDKLVIGSIIGVLIMILAVLSDKSLRKQNDGKVIIYYQKVIIPIVYLIVASIAMFFIIRIFIL